MTVLHVEQPPTWLKNPITLSMNEETPLALDLSKYAVSTNPGDVLTFGLVSGPSWASVASNGAMTGTPQIANEGVNTFAVTVTDKAGTVTSGQVLITVLHVEHPPVWTQDPILATVNELQAFSLDLTAYTKSVNPGDVLTYALVDGPSWATVTPKGVMAGTPQIANEGPNTFEVSVTDKAGSVATGHVIVTVNHVEHPPTWIQNPITVSTPELSPFTLDLTKYAVSINPGDILTYALVSGPSWATVSSTGSMAGTPLIANEGVNNFTVSVTDKAGSVVAAQVVVTVTHVEQPPTWTVNPITLTVNELQPVTLDLTAYAVSHNPNDKLTYALVSGPSWATVTPVGSFAGTPGLANEGATPLR